MVDTSSRTALLEEFYEADTAPRLSSLLLLPDTLPAWLQTLVATLRPDHMADTPEQALATLKSHRPEIIIAADTRSPALAFLKALEQTGAYRPVRLLISEELDDPSLYHYADAVLPPLPRYIHHQVHRLSSLHTENARLRAENQTLADEHRELKTQLDAARKTSEELALLKSAVVRTVSHELGTPLLQVKSAVALLAEDAENRTLVDYALGATTRLEAVVKNITQLAHSIDEMNLSVLLIRECIDYAVRNLRRTWEHRDETTRIKVYYEPQVAPVTGDKQAISTALQLLVDNALKFSEKDVEVHVHQKDDHVMIAVKDYGIGIPKDKQEAVFQTFYQVDSSSTRRVGGMGVGLAIVQLILERHGTKIVLQSDEGQGSIFAFSLPVAQIEAE